MTREQHQLEKKYPVRSKEHKQRMIKHWLIAIVVLAIIVWGFAGMPALELKAKSIEILKSILMDYSIPIGVTFIFQLEKTCFVVYLKRLPLLLLVHLSQQ